MYYKKFQKDKLNVLQKTHKLTVQEDKLNVLQKILSKYKNKTRRKFNASIVTNRWKPMFYPFAVLQKTVSKLKYVLSTQLSHCSSTITRYRTADPHWSMGAEYLLRSEKFVNQPFGMHHVYSAWLSLRAPCRLRVTQIRKLAYLQCSYLTQLTQNSSRVRLRGLC